VKIYWTCTLILNISAKASILMRVQKSMQMSIVSKTKKNPKKRRFRYPKYDAHKTAQHMQLGFFFFSDLRKWKFFVLHIVLLHSPPYKKILNFYMHAYIVKEEMKKGTDTKGVFVPKEPFTLPIFVLLSSIPIENEQKLNFFWRSSSAAHVISHFS